LRTSTNVHARPDLRQRLRDQADQDVYGWILEREPAPAPFDGPLMNKLKAFRDEAYKGVAPGTTRDG